MQPAFFSLILIAVHVSVPVDCTPRLRDPEQLLQRQQSSYNRGTHADTAAGAGRFYMEMSGSMRKGSHRHFLVILPVRTDTSDFVSIFDLRRKQFLCMDSKGELFNSRHKEREDCLFQRIWLDLANQRDVFYSTSGGRLLKLQGAELRVAHQEPPEPSSALVESFLGPLVKRQRRSEEVNPSDPLRSQPSHPAMDHKDADHGQPEQDQAGAVSKQTITSCDDPLRVLQPNGPVSPVKTNIADRAEQD
ncbi:fibroblast growth factor 23-like [Cottoperca gobio]|uniref:Fibroblast growth factor 23-like n=1 Tax=Cottoperca gobio TaxID=56716 RepID=A0A6J2Q034_COTGO|nr:fibroblast growth factor 23-like [Cottoperca gobio]